MRPYNSRNWTHRRNGRIRGGARFAARNAIRSTAE